MRHAERPVWYGRSRSLVRELAGALALLALGGTSVGGFVGILNVATRALGR